jgi:hypothetical protein
VCPVDCIHPDPDWKPENVPDDWWSLPHSSDDPY